MTDESDMAPRMTSIPATTFTMEAYLPSADKAGADMYAMAIVPHAARMLPAFNVMDAAIRS